MAQTIAVVTSLDLHTHMDFVGYSSYGSNNERHVMRLIDSALWRPRSYVEDDDKFKQLIPYVVVHDVKENCVLVYDRSGSEKRLHSLSSIGFGGHIDKPDATNQGDRNFIEVAALRELNEELRLETHYSNLIHEGFVNGEVTAVDKVHLGVVYTYCVLKNEIDLSKVDPEISNPRWVNIRDLAGNFERWSQFVIEGMFRRDASGLSV